MNFAMVGGVLAFLAVALGAFGAHGLKSRISKEMLSVYEKGVMYEMYHALALIAVGILIHTGFSSQMLSIAGWLFILGTILFSGSLYILSITGKKILGAITPFGGLCFLAGWVIFAVGIA